jgi:hypothetical protein
MSDPRPAPSLTSSTTTTTTVDRDKPAAGLSLPQIAAGALAAVTAAVAASFLGVAGTLIGAAVASVVSTLATTMYSTSLSHAARASRTLVVRRILAPGEPTPTDVPAAAVPTTEGAPTGPAGATTSIWRNVRWKPVALVAGLVFVAAMAVVSVSELALGHPLSNSGESGTTLSNLGGSSSQVPTTPTPAGTPTESATSTPTSSDSLSTSPEGSSTSPTTSPTTSPAELQTTAPSTTAPQTTTQQGGGTSSSSSTAPTSPAG